MVKRGRSSWRRHINRYISVVAALVGLGIVASSFLFLDNLYGWYVSVIVGLLVVLAGFWYAAHPFMTSERHNLVLRGAVDDFIQLVRELNRVNLTDGDTTEFERIKSEMVASVDRIAALVRGVDEPGARGEPETREHAEQRL